MGPPRDRIAAAIGGLPLRQRHRAVAAWLDAQTLWPAAGQASASSPELRSDATPTSA